MSFCRRQPTRHPTEASYEAQRQSEVVSDTFGPKDMPDDSDRSTQWSAYGTSHSSGYPGQYSDGTLGSDKRHVVDYAQGTLPLPTSKGNYGSRNHIYESPQFS